MNDLIVSRLKFKYEELIGVWKDYVTKHTELYELTCREYTLLLESDIETLEATIAQKQNILAYISKLEVQRTAIINDFASADILDINIDKMGNLFDALTPYKEHLNLDQLERLNLFLVDVIEKIQDQNKKNQFYLNRAIHSLNDLQKSFTGKKYDTYSNTGESKANSY